MKRLSLALIILLIISTAVPQGYSQSPKAKHKSIISTKVVVLRYKHQDSSFLQNQTDTLKIPVVLGNYPALKKELSYKKILFGHDLKAVIKDYSDCSCGITGLDYEVAFESKDVISIKLDYETMGAYPDTDEKWLTLNVNSGKLYPISNEITPEGMKWLFKNYKDTLIRRLNDEKNEIENEADGINVYNVVKEAIDNLKSNELFEKYIFTRTGIMLSINRILPHVVAALEPDDNLLILYKNLKPYISQHAIVLASSTSQF